MKHMSHSVQASTTAAKSSDFTPSTSPDGLLVDQREQARKRIAQIEAPPAAMTDVEDAPHLGVELRGIREIGVAPIECVARGRFKAAFAGHGLELRS